MEKTLACRMAIPVPGLIDMISKMRSVFRSMIFSVEKYQKGDWDEDEGNRKVR